MPPQETVKKHGADQVQIWRRSFDIPPPDIEESSEFNPAKVGEMGEQKISKVMGLMFDFMIFLGGIRMW